MIGGTKLLILLSAAVEAKINFVDNSISERGGEKGRQIRRYTYCVTIKICEKCLNIWAVILYQCVLYNYLLPSHWILHNFNHEEL